MILLVQIICLCYTLYVLQEYATSGAYSRQHRLLPLLVGLIGVYNFYQVVLTLTGPVSYTHLDVYKRQVFRVLGSVGADCYRCG